MTKIALLTCDQFPDLIPADQKLISLLHSRKIIADAVIWNDPSVTWHDYDALLFRSTWDYFLMDDLFTLWLDKMETLGIPTYNSVPVIKKNKHKFYLSEMAEAGIRIIPSVFIPKTPSLDLSQLLPASWHKAVIKPAVSAGSYLTKMFDMENVILISDEYRDIAAEKDLILQKFIPEIQTHGEISLIFFNKKFSHAVIKTPKEGDFRIQSQFGGIYSPYDPSTQTLNIAQNIVHHVGEKLLYARVDGILIDDEFHLMELELIEPDLYLDFAAEAQSKFVDEIIHALYLK
jgi:glutathione synthase/RimK-type ligase-like ATP-grasp enzyme